MHVSNEKSNDNHIGLLGLSQQTKEAGNGPYKNTKINLAEFKW